MLSIAARQFFRFALVGLLSTALNYSVFLIFLKSGVVPYLIAATVGFVAGGLIGFQLNRNWTYRASSGAQAYLPSYTILYLSSLLFGLVCLALFVEIFGLGPEFANLLTIGLTTAINFAGTKFWVFRS